MAFLYIVPILCEMCAFHPNYVATNVWRKRKDSFFFGGGGGCCDDGTNFWDCCAGSNYVGSNKTGSSQVGAPYLRLKNIQGTTIGNICKKIICKKKQKLKKRPFRLIKRFYKPETSKKCKGVPFDRIRKFSKKSRIVPKKNQTKNETKKTFGLASTFGSIKKFVV